MELHEYVFTFGCGHAFLANRYVVIKAPTPEEAREEMVSYFGDKWAFQYPSREEAGVTRFGLTELEPKDRARSLRYG